MKKLVLFLLMMSAAAQAQVIVAKSINKTKYVSQYLNVGVTVGQAIDAACLDLQGNPGVVVIEGFVGAGASVIGTPWNCAVMDWRNAGETYGSGNYLSSLEMFRLETRDASAITTIRGALTLRYDDQDGGVNSISLPNKTQSQLIAGIYNGVDVGEHHGFYNGQVNCAGSGDCLTYMAIIVGMGGYGTGGDEGQEGIRIWNNVGDGTSTGGVPVATGVSVAGNLVLGTWTNPSRLGVRNAPLLVTNRLTYSTGTLTSTSFSAGVCHIIGTGTAWTGLTGGAGAHSNLFLRIPQYESASAKYVVPVTAVNSDTDISIGYTLNETGTQCPAGLTAGGAYTIYLGQLVTHVSQPNVPSGNLIQVTVANSGTILSNDNVEQPIDYNVTPYGFFVTQNSPFTPGGNHTGVGVYVENVGSGGLESGIRVNGQVGEYAMGIRLMNKVTVGIQGADQMATFMRSSDTRAGTLSLFNVLNTSSTSFSATWDRTNSWWHWGGLYMDGPTTRISTNSTPAANTEFYLGYGTAGYGGMVIAPSNVGANGLGLQIQDGQGFASFEFPTGIANMVLNNGRGIIGYLNDHTAAQWNVNGTTGVITVNGISNSGNTATGTLAVGGGSSISFYKTATDAPGAITINSQTCTDRQVTVTGATSAAAIQVAAGYAFEANLGLTAGRADNGFAHYRICNPTPGNITLAAGATFTIAVTQ